MLFNSILRKIEKMNDITPTDRSSIMESVLVKGDLSKLTPQERNDYYLAVCRSLGLNPLTKPLDYIVLSGKTVLYAKRDAADQLRKLNGVSIEITDKHFQDGLIVVTVKATDKTGRIDSDMGVVPMPKGADEIRSNAILKAVTKAKRRVTLSICGLGFLDESEVESIPQRERLEPEHEAEIAQLEEGEDKDPREIAMESAAKKGMKNLQAIWRDMPNEDRRRLQPHLAKYKALAAEADEAK